MIRWDRDLEVDQARHQGTVEMTQALREIYAGMELASIYSI